MCNHSISYDVWPLNNLDVELRKLAVLAAKKKESLLAQLSGCVIRPSRSRSLHSWLASWSGDVEIRPRSVPVDEYITPRHYEAPKFRVPFPVAPTMSHDRFEYTFDTPSWKGKTCVNTGIFIGGTFRPGSEGKTIE